MSLGSDNFETTQLEIKRSINQKQKSELGQFMTPQPIAHFMASLFTTSPKATCKLLDPGAGAGSLCSAFIDRCLSGKLKFNNIELHALEIDNKMQAELSSSLARYTKQNNILANTLQCDFIEKAVNDYLPSEQFFTHAILNPPYKKINSDSEHRHLLRKAEIETVNLYSAFVALSILLLKPAGQLVAIIPRSFCNGPYYEPFRKLILEKTSIRHIHLFDSRNKAFKDDGVLQENIIIFLERNKQCDEVTISTSTDDSFSDFNQNQYPFSRIVNKDDIGKFIHIPTTKTKSALELSSKISNSLADLDIQVSTGPIVDFRTREYLRLEPEAGAVPLLYPGHLAGLSVKWPNLSLKKANAITVHPNVNKWLYPSGFYTVIKRFSSKEEKKRIMASIIDPTLLPYPKIGFENHLNVLHHHKQGLPECIARGLAIFLNSTIIDNHFRQFNGHTQVNATDLRLMKYPNRDILSALGEWSKIQDGLDQVKIDNKIEMIL